MNKKLVALGSLASVLVGCAAAQVAQDVQPPAADKTIVVMGVPVKGVYPDEAKLFFWLGAVERGVFRKGAGNAAIATAPVDGYIVTEVDAGTTLALADVYVNHDKEHAVLQSSSGTSHFKAAGGEKTAVFTVPGGKVIYIGDIGLDVTLPGLHDFGDGALKLSPASDLAAAQAYVDAHYPGLKGRLESQPLQVAPIRFSLAEIVTITPVVQSALNPTWTWVD
jgi:hypothetical protein